MEQEQSATGISRRSALATCAAGIAALSGCLVHGESSPLRGSIIVDGSNTVLPHGSAVAEEFLWRNNRVNIPVRGSGTGAGFQQFCQGATDIQNASREIHDSEITLCGTEGVDFVELTTLRDGIAIYAHPDNDWCEYLTVEELQAIWGSGSEVQTWADVRPEEDWPDEEIALFGRDPASGTFDSYTERLMGEVGNIRNDYSASADTNVIVRGVSGDRYALGWGGAGYFYENTDRLKLIGVDDADSPIDGYEIPTVDSIEDEQQYPRFSRDMYIYVNANELRRETLRAFTEFYFEPIDEQTHEQAVENDIADPDEELTWTQWAARKVGFYAIPDEVVENSKETLRNAIEEYA